MADSWLENRHESLRIFHRWQWLSGDEETKNVNPSDVGVLYRVGQNRPQYRDRLREAEEEEPTRNGRQESNGRTR